MPHTGPVQFWCAADGGRLYFRFEHAATHRVARAVEPLAAEFFAQDHAEPVVALDLGACEYLDSTFAGWMIRLRHRLEPRNGRVVVAACSSMCRANLDVMGLSALFDFEPLSAPGDLRRVTCEDPDVADPEAIELMLHAHEELAHVNPDNERAFTPIAETLRRELDKRR